ncbi:CREB/ATF bZIP transcription factor isoform X2 [Pundamilia nyererei]|uniref:CREB/ATF bZIP transcription factor isoform X2 n=1 Tax=Pundamilia nyererei TaxID=303518 RepID=A0A9Y6MCD6_9CICH|nr:PREDICTED: CREB/ATF bZIP transcription factor isoform X2 [Pundamilia nyererei]
MITRRSRTVTNTEVQSPEVEAVDVESMKDLPIPCDGFRVKDVDAAGVELDDLFEDLKWTLDRDASSSLFNIDLADLCVYNTKDGDSGLEASTASSPERYSSDSQNSRQKQSSHVTNKNAIAARLNRLKKKEYVNSLEQKIGMLSTENSTLKIENSQLTKRVEELEDETRGPTQTSTTTPYPGNGPEWRKKKHLVACVFMWTRIMSQWSSAPSVQRVQARCSKCRVKYFSLFSDIETELDGAQCAELEAG